MTLTNHQLFAEAYLNDLLSAKNDISNTNVIEQNIQQSVQDLQPLVDFFGK